MSDTGTNVNTSVKTRSAAKKIAQLEANDQVSVDSSVEDHEEGEELTNVALMIRLKCGVSYDMFIVNTGCLGSHVYRTSDLLTRVTSVSSNTHEVKDFSGNAHQTTCRGYLHLTLTNKF